MGTTYRIAEASRRSGFSASTLRYYEDIGLMPPATRSEAGYRGYDEVSLARLAFIARAKQLGCTLDEIADLVTAWDGGRCEPVQTRLRDAVAQRIDDAQRRLADLTVFTAQLQKAAAALSLNTPDGPCDDSCGCVATTGAASPTDVTWLSLSPRPAAPEAKTPPIACTLADDEMRDRVDDWQAVLGQVAARERIDGGIRLTFSAEPPVSDIARLIVAEQACCAFFSFALTVDTRGPALEVRAPADALGIVTGLFGSSA